MGSGRWLAAAVGDGRQRPSRVVTDSDGCNRQWLAVRDDSQVAAVVGNNGRQPTEVCHFHKYYHAHPYPSTYKLRELNMEQSPTHDSLALLCFISCSISPSNSSESTSTDFDPLTTKQFSNVHRRGFGKFSSERFCFRTYTVVGFSTIFLDSLPPLITTRALRSTRA
ncbi:uncharacterized protein J3R85_018456 [Psidium guajava]|nr:uncharacterized protein J3R85_018456 [Psidium guajava]